jgi:hypothetical protein
MLRFLFLFSLLVSCLGLSLFAAEPRSLPYYEGDVRFSLEQRTLRGSLEVHIPVDSQGSEWIFALPMNRFLAPDERGLRRSKQTPIFASSTFSQNDDPLQPNGFSQGEMIIQSVNHDGQELDFRLEDNPNIEVGYSVRNGLLRIANTGGLEKVRIEFETRFPERYEEGIVDQMLVSAEWYPLFLGSLEQAPDLRLDEPSPAHFRIRWRSAETGHLITTNVAEVVPADTAIQLPTTQRPVKYFPLIFSLEHQQLETPPSEIHSFYRDAYSRRVGLLQQWAEEYVGYLQTEYQLRIPWEDIKLVEVPGRSEDVRVFNNIVLVTRPHYERTEFMDRRVLGLFTMGLGKLWFGETIWHNEDSQMWLSRGIPIFLSMRFYEQKFGRDAGIFDFINWMNPQFKEHFVEDMARSGKLELLRPIASSFRENAATSEHLKAVNYKAAMVMSMLEYYVEKENFRRGLLNFFVNRQYQTSTHRNLKYSMEQVTGADLRWFFEQWFETTKRLDYAVGEVSYEEIAENRYLVRVEVLKPEEAVMPIDLVLRTDDEAEYRKRIFSRRSLYIVQFRTNSPPDEVSLDPQEYLLETSRVNNHSFTFLRLRFAFDWKKQREQMVTFVPGIANNAIDGNSFGVGLRHRQGDYSVYAIPGYGTKSRDFLYQLEVRKQNFLRRNFFGEVVLRRVGGVRSEGVQGGYQSPTYPDRYSYSIQAGVALEYLYSTDARDGDTGDSNVVTAEYTGQNATTGDYITRWSVSTEQPSQELETSYSYALWSESLTQIFQTGFRSSLQWRLLLSNTLGSSPDQKKFSLGGPQTLRGYPQSGDLSQENLLVSRLDYEFPLVTNPWWGNISSLGLQGTIFYDQGRAWGKNEELTDSVDRRNIGIGLRMGVDAASLVQIPIKLEIAVPVGDEEYDRPQFIFFGVLTGS